MMRVLTMMIGLLISTCLTAQKAYDMNLSEALRKTYEENPTLDAARRQLLGVQEQLPQALAGWRPTVQVDLSVGDVDITGEPLGPGSDGSSPKEAVISLEQPLYRGGATRAATRAAENTIKAQKASLLNTQQNVLSAAVEAYMDLLRDQNLLSLSKKNRDVIAEQLRATRDRFEAGTVTRTDIKQAEARLAGADANVIRVEGQLESSRAVFEQIVGLSAQNLMPPDAQIQLPQTLQDCLNVAKERSPLLLRSKALQDAQKYNVDVVAGSLRPQISFQTFYTGTLDPSPGFVDDSSETFVGIVAKVPVYQAGSLRSRLREAKHEAFRRTFLLSESERAVQQQVHSGWLTLKAAKAEIRARRLQIEAAEIAREGVYREAAEGIRTVLDTLDADQELLDAQVNIVIATRDEVVASFNLAATLGLLTPEFLNFPQ